MLLARTLAAAAVLLAVPAAAQDREAEFRAALEAAVLPIEQDADGTLSGPGFDALLAAAQDAQFVLIGEQHAAREIALAELSLHAALAPQGFDHLVVEIGPWSTREVERLVRSGDGALAGYIREPGHAFVFPFLFFEEEIALVEQAVALSPRADHVLWGVDQEFLGAGPLLLDLLRAEAGTAAQTAAVDRFAQGVAANFMYAGTLPDEDLAALEAAFADGTEEARALVDAIAVTRRIYAPFTGGGGFIYPANLERENYLKANFLAHFLAAEDAGGAPPRAIFKFGGNHMDRGNSSTYVPALGNFVVEWGRSRGFAAMNVMLDCLGGEIWDVQGGAPAPCESYALDEGSPLFAAIGDAPRVLVDLRPLRAMAGRAEALDPRLADLILSYDFYLLLRDVTAQTPVTDLTFPGS